MINSNSNNNLSNERVERPQLGVGDYRRYDKKDPDTQEMAEFRVFISHQVVLDRSYNYRDLGVTIPNFEGKVCRELDFYGRYSYITKRITSHGLSQLLLAIPDICYDDRTTVKRGQIFVGGNIRGENAIFFLYRQSNGNRGAIIFDENSSLLTYLTISEEQENILNDFKEFHLEKL